MKCRDLFLSVALLARVVGALDESFDQTPGPGLPDGWEVGSVDWRVQEGAARFCCGDYAFALPPVRASDEATIEAMVNVARRANHGWAVAALALRHDTENYWHLALVEAPAEQGGRHFVELSEKLDGRWLAQNEPETRLTVSSWEGASFNWQYGRTYRLKLVLRKGSIEGTVSEPDGTVCSRLAYQLDRRAIDRGVPALSAAWFETRFDDVRVSVGTPAPPPPARTFPAYDRPGDDALRLRGTGFFRVEHIDDRDWIIDPQGRVFYIVATDHVSYQGHWCEALGYAPYARVAAAKYTNEENWAVATIGRLKDWGFNTLAAGHSPSLRYRGLPHIDFAAFGTSFAARDALCERTFWTGFPNVFSPDWPRHCDLLARQRAAEQRDDPWLLGVFLDNELEWYGKSGQPDGLFEQAWLKPAGHTAKSAWVEFLRGRPGGLEAFNRNFGLSFSDFDALARDIVPRRPRNEEGRITARDFVRLVAECYFRGCSEALRRHDPNHLNLGCRFAGRAPDVWDIAGKYCDVVSLNTYPRIEVDHGVPARVALEVAAWQAQTGRPFFITEWSFPALDAGLPSRHGAGMRVDSQAQRARCFSFFQEFLFRQPAIVGSSYFMYLDEPALGISKSFPEDSNYGLVDGNDQPYSEMTQAARRLNPHAVRLHREGGFVPAALPESPVLPVWIREAVPEAGVPPVPPTVRSGKAEMAFAGAAGWTYALGGKVVAEMHPLLHIVDGRDYWLRPSDAKLTAAGDHARVRFFDVEFTFAPAANDPRTARALMRYWFPKGEGGWMASQGRWVENTGAVTWRLGDLYHYLTPKPAGDPARVQPLNDIPAYYRQLPAWADLDRGVTLGAGLLPGSRLQGEYWKDCPSCFHSDLREIVDRELPAGTRWEASPEPVFFFSAAPPTRISHAQRLSEIQAE